MSDSVANSKTVSKIVDEVVVLDLDRTLLNTGLVTDMLLSRLLQYGVTKKQRDAMKGYVESQTGNSLDFFAWLEGEIKDVSIDVLIEDTLQNITPEQGKVLLCTGAAELIEVLELKSASFFILTYGEYRYQNFKIRLFRQILGKSNDAVPAVLTTQSHKGRWIAAEWFNDSDEFATVPAGLVDGWGDVHAHSVVIVDDKRQNLVSSGKRVVGILVNDTRISSELTYSLPMIIDAVRSGQSLTSSIASRYE